MPLCLSPFFFSYFLFIFSFAAMIYVIDVLSSEVKTAEVRVPSFSLFSLRTTRTDLLFCLGPTRSP
jgi:hypothetical protein